jgi:hypothetical protein
MGLFNKDRGEPTEIAMPMEMPYDPGMMGGGGVPYPMMRSDKADLLEKIRPERAVEECRYRLMGFDMIDGEWKEVSYLKHYSLSKEGAWAISTLMFAVSNQNVSLSALKDNEIRARALRISKAAMRMILAHWEDYNIIGTDQIHYVGEIVFSIAFITLKQSQNEGIRSLLKGTMQESYTHVQQEKAKGIKDMFSFRR